MLDKKVFLKCINSLLLFGSVKPENARNEMLYRLIMNDFEDTEFSKICGDICRTEDLYGKYPIPKMFYDRKKQSQNNILVESGSFFVDDTFPKYREALAGLDQSQADKVCENVWKWLIDNKSGEMVSEQFIVDRIKQFRAGCSVSLESPFTLSDAKNLLENHNKEGFDA